MQKFWGLLGYETTKIQTFTLRVSSKILEDAVIRGDDEIIKALLASKSNDVSYDDQKLLDLAFKHKHPSIIKLLLSDSRFYLSNCENIKMVLDLDDILELILSRPEINPSFEDNYVLQYLHRNNKTGLIKLVINHPKFVESPTLSILISNYRQQFKTT